MKNITEIIGQKTRNIPLTTEQIKAFVRGYTRDEIPDYQVAALLMAIYLLGMDRRETVDLTLAMAASGEQLDLHDVAPVIVDKHSSGGVGDKTTLVVQPIVAAAGVAVGKMSGRGLGSSGGTLDKMESFSGWSPDLSLEQFKRQLADIGLVLAGQSVSLAPADGKLYALRDVTGTVANKSLIAASIMSKKLAAGADVIVLDVKTGSGAFMATVADAEELAQLMVDIGTDAGRKTVALISDMNQPLGHAVGNALEVKEALAMLRGAGPADLWHHCRTVAAWMLLLAGRAGSLEEAQELATAVRDDGRALAKFRAMVVAQGGDGAQVDQPDRLPLAPCIGDLIAPQGGTIAAMDTGELGWVTVRMGCGRQAKGDEIDHALGFVLEAKIGDEVTAGQRIGSVHAAEEAALASAQSEIMAAISFSTTPVDPLPTFYAVITADGKRALPAQEARDLEQGS